MTRDSHGKVYSHLVGVFSSVGAAQPCAKGQGKGRQRQVSPMTICVWMLLLCLAADGYLQLTLLWLLHQAVAWLEQHRSGDEPGGREQANSIGRHRALRALHCAGRAMRSTCEPELAQSPL